MILPSIFKNITQNTKTISILALPDHPNTIKNGEFKGIEKTDYESIISKYGGIPDIYIVEEYSNCNVYHFILQNNVLISNEIRHNDNNEIDKNIEFIPVRNDLKTRSRSKSTRKKNNIYLDHSVKEVCDDFKVENRKMTTIDKRNTQMKSINLLFDEEKEDEALTFDSKEKIQNKKIKIEG